MRSKNSTNVRTVTQRATALLAKGLDPVAPRMAGELAARVFFTTVPREETPAERVLFSGARKQLVRFGDKRLVSWSFGEGPTVLLVHGWNGSASQLGPFVAPLRARGFRVVAFDGPAHGQSDGVLTTLPEMADAIRAVVEHEGAVAGVVAHSLGGAAVTLALGRGASLGRVALVSPPIDPRVWVDRLVAAIGLSETVHRETLRAIEARAGVRLDSLALLDVAPRLTSTPVLIVHDEKDREVDVRAGRALAAAWPNARLVTTEGLGHRRILSDRHVVETVADFVGAYGPTRRTEEPLAIHA